MLGLSAVSDGLNRFDVRNVQAERPGLAAERAYLGDDRVAPLRRHIGQHDTRGGTGPFQIDRLVGHIVAVNGDLTDGPAVGNAGDIEVERTNHADYTKPVVASALRHSHARGVTGRSDVGAQSLRERSNDS